MFSLISQCCEACFPTTRSLSFGAPHQELTSSLLEREDERNSLVTDRGGSFSEFFLVESPGVSSIQMSRGEISTGHLSFAKFVAIPSIGINSGITVFKNIVSVPTTSYFLKGETGVSSGEGTFKKGPLKIHASPSKSSFSFNPLASNRERLRLETEENFKKLSNEISKISSKKKTFIEKRRVMLERAFFLELVKRVSDPTQKEEEEKQVGKVFFHLPEVNWIHEKMKELRSLSEQEKDPINKLLVRTSTQQSEVLEDQLLLWRGAPTFYALDVIERLHYYFSWISQLKEVYLGAKEGQKTSLIESKETAEFYRATQARQHLFHKLSSLLEREFLQYRFHDIFPKGSFVEEMEKACSQKGKRSQDREEFLKIAQEDWEKSYHYYQAIHYYLELLFLPTLPPSGDAYQEALLQRAFLHEERACISDSLSYRELNTPEEVALMKEKNATRETRVQLLDQALKVEMPLPFPRTKQEEMQRDYYGKVIESFLHALEEHEERKGSALFWEEIGKGMINVLEMAKEESLEQEKDGEQGYLRYASWELKKKSWAYYEQAYADRGEKNHKVIAQSLEAGRALKAAAFYQQKMENFEMLVGKELREIGALSQEDLKTVVQFYRNAAIFYSQGDFKGGLECHKASQTFMYKKKKGVLLPQELHPVWRDNKVFDIPTLDTSRLP